MPKEARRSSESGNLVLAKCRKVLSQPTLKTQVRRALTPLLSGCDARSLLRIFAIPCNLEFCQIQC